ncbi:cysteine peroxiredoxin [Desarmillaria tabescens]|uniref:Cysteine peroxiredoxin n=1 Tax=Armillaria tabescens TaxID=1929756 RepID=A0AA39NQE1_ARMTA|nr:cysteine peroxiredoxin [Desarmillaria tabescens]KAK0469775.1 cysteine peroxiredoxin [Desarmillaria tabescens]
MELNLVLITIKLSTGIAPDFEAETGTLGEINFHEWLGEFGLSHVKGVLFSRPGDFTPVNTIELDIEVYGGNTTGPTYVEYPIVSVVLLTLIAKISHLYDMLDYHDVSNRDAKGLPFTICTVFVINSKKVIRLTISYPAVSGCNFDEIIRVIDAIQLGDKNRIATPVNWNKGDDLYLRTTPSKVN